MTKWIVYFWIFSFYFANYILYLSLTGVHKALLTTFVLEVLRISTLPTTHWLVLMNLECSGIFFNPLTVSKTAYPIKITHMLVIVLFKNKSNYDKISL